MTWQAPKTDWHASNELHVAGDDFNRIEGNTLHNHDRFNSLITMCSEVYDTTIQAETESDVLQVMFIRVPPGKSLRATRLNSFLPEQWTISLTHETKKIIAGEIVAYDPIITGGGTLMVITTTPNRVVDIYDVLIRDNTDVVDNIVMLKVKVYNGTLTPTSFLKGSSGWFFSFVLVDS